MLTYTTYSEAGALGKAPSLGISRMLTPNKDVTYWSLTWTLNKVP